MVSDYSKLAEALRCKRDDCEGCDLSFFDKDEGWMCQYAAKDDDAADAIEKLVTLYEKAEMDATNLTGKLTQAEAQLPKHGKWVRKESENIYWFECSECGGHPMRDTWDGEGKLTDFCPRCGADMRKMEVQDGKNET